MILSNGRRPRRPFLFGQGAAMLPAVFRCLVFLAVTAGCTQTTRPVGKFVGHDGRIIAAAFSAEGQLLASIGTDGTARVWDFASQKELARTPIEPPPGLYMTDPIAFSADGSRITFADAHGDVFVWDPRAGDLPRRIGRVDPPVRHCAFASDGQSLTIVSGGLALRQDGTSSPTPSPRPLRIRRLDLNGGEVRPEFVSSEPVVVTAVSGNGAVAAYTVPLDGHSESPATSRPAFAARLVVIDIDAAKTLFSTDLQYHHRPILSLNGQYLIAGDSLWHPASGSALMKVPGATAFVDSDRKILAIEGARGLPMEMLPFQQTTWMRASRYEIATGRTQRGPRMTGTEIPFGSVYAPDGRHAVDYDLKLWRLRL